MQSPRRRHRAACGPDYRESHQETDRARSAMAPQTAHQHHRSICRVAVQSKMKQRARAPRQSAAQGDRRATWWCQMQSEADPGLPAIRGRPGRAFCAPSTQTPPAMDLLRFSPASSSAESKREGVRVTRARSRSRALAQTSYRGRYNADAAAREDLASGRDSSGPCPFSPSLLFLSTVRAQTSSKTRTGFDFFSPSRIHVTHTGRRRIYSYSMILFIEGPRAPAVKPGRITQA